MGPIFGDSDIYIISNCNKKLGSHSKLGKSFEKNENNFEFHFTGTKEFFVEDYEVYCIY